MRTQKEHAGEIAIEGGKHVCVIPDALVIEGLMIEGLAIEGKRVCAQEGIAIEEMSLRSRRGRDRHKGRSNQSKEDLDNQSKEDLNGSVLTEKGILTGQ